MRSTWEDLVEFFQNRKGNFYPEGTLINALYFYGPPVATPDGFPESPCAIHSFESPVTEDVAHAAIVAVAKDGGVMAQNGYFIPWPVGAIYFELAPSKPPAKDKA